MYHLLYLISALLLTFACHAISLPPIQAIQSPSSDKPFLVLPSANRTTTPLLTGWPTLPFHAHVAEDIYLVIESYHVPSDYNLRGYILGNLTKIEDRIIEEANPDGLVDNKRIFRSGLVSTRFPAVAVEKGDVATPPRITNEMALQVLGAAWELQHVHGPRGFSYATVEVGGRPWSFFCLWV